MLRNVLIEKSFEQVKEFIKNKKTYQGLYQVENKGKGICIEVNTDEVGTYYVKLYKEDDCWISDDDFERSININNFNTLDELFDDMENYL